MYIYPYPYPISILLYKCKSLFAGSSFFHAAAEQRIDMIFGMNVFKRLKCDLGYFLCRLTQYLEGSVPVLLCIFDLFSVLEKFHHSNQLNYLLQPFMTWRIVFTPSVIIYIYVNFDLLFLTKKKILLPIKFK